jgi:hypothetical protein
MIALVLFLAAGTLAAVAAVTHTTKVNLGWLAVALLAAGLVFQAAP